MQITYFNYSLVEGAVNTNVPKLQYSTAIVQSSLIGCRTADQVGKRAPIYSSYNIGVWA